MLLLKIEGSGHNFIEADPELNYSIDIVRVKKTASGWNYLVSHCKKGRTVEGTQRSWYEIKWIRMLRQTCFGTGYSMTTLKHILKYVWFFDIHFYLRKKHV